MQSLFASQIFETIYSYLIFFQIFKLTNQQKQTKTNNTHIPNMSEG